MADEFDVIVIGAGPPGENAAGRSADRGFSVAIVEERLAGGECSYYGCIPSKTLIRPGDVLAAARRVPGAAEAVTGAIDVQAAFAQRDYMTNNWDDAGDLKWFDSKGIAFVRGHGRMAGPKAVEVETPEGTRRLEARKAVVVACGTVPLFPPIEGLADAKPWDNRDATAVKELPRRLLVLGGGAIGAEMAQAFRRLGTEEVTLVEGADRLLAREEPFAGEEVRASFEAEGITVITGARMTKVRRDGSDGPVTGTLEDGREVTADEILVAVGRRANTTDVGFDTVGLEPGRFLSVDDRLRATGIDGDWLYDVRDIGDRVAIPRVTFTDPQVAAVGLTEAQAKERELNIRVVSYDIGAVSGAYVRGNGIHGTGQIIVDEDRRVIVGATFTGPDVQEILHAATIAIVGEVTLDTLWHAVPSFPTVSEVWLRLLEAYGL